MSLFGQTTVLPLRQKADSRYRGLALVKRAWITHVARYSTVVGAALPEPAAEAFNVTYPLLLVGKVHFPYQRPVTENPHDVEDV